MNEAEKLDQYYTKFDIALQCYQTFQKVLSKIVNPNFIFIEPSAGSGVFLQAISDNYPKQGFDISPVYSTIQKNDFLQQDFRELLSSEEKQKHIVFIGNPPFGRKSELAIQFVNRCFEFSDVLGFILPLQFRKWSAQSKITPLANLILDMKLPENSFEFEGKDYKVRCCFQVWALEGFSDQFQNLRILEKPNTYHNDFRMYQYNRTEDAKKFFDYDWDFAVPRQGYVDYSFKAYSKSQCDMKQQWIFFKAKDDEVLKKLLAIDFEKLSCKNIGIPGFGKADVIEEYKRRN
ncbi:Uncharacterised protein [uncultured archaeon]|nr:Uncharacterised protein [uncultured archaeon]